jgi:hypothetical protein
MTNWRLLRNVIIGIALGSAIVLVRHWYFIDCTHGVLQPECIWPAPGGF